MMLINQQLYFELPAPLTMARQFLARALPTVGSDGRLPWVGRRWRIERYERRDTIIWQGWSDEPQSAYLLLTATLEDAQVATLVTLRVSIAGLRGREALRLRWGLRRDLQRGIGVWQAASRERNPAPVAPPHLPSDPETLSRVLAETHPRTVAAFEAMGALPRLAAVAALDRRWQATERGAVPTDLHHVVTQLPPTEQDYDLIYAGGGLGLLHATVMQRRYGYRVLVFDRDEVGCAHREWNISDDELQAFQRLDLFTAEELSQIVMRRYHDGVVRFDPTHAGVTPAELHLPDVLNVGLDAEALLRRARLKFAAAGGKVLDFHQFRSVQARADGGVAVEVIDDAGQRHCYGARLLLDGMGAASPLALLRYAGHPFAGVCPTVGTVVRGLQMGTGPQQHNPDVGDVLVSVADTQRGRQLIWEGFAGRDDELTVYVFYYDLVGAARKRLISAQHHSLLDLFEDYFALLPTYKRPGPDFAHVKPVYGFIPARHAQRRVTALPLASVLPVGDSGAQQSPLTFCGFGSHVRNLDRTTRLLDYALRHDLLAPEHLQHISAYQSNVALNWVFSRFMQPWRGPADVNRLQNVFARVLNELGTHMAVRFFKDQMRWGDYGRIVNHTLQVYRLIVPTALEVLGPRATMQWIVDYGRFSVAALQASVGRTLGPHRLDRLTTALERRNPAWAFRLWARRAEWEAMGWFPRLNIIDYLATIPDDEPPISMQEINVLVHEVRQRI